MNNNKIRIEEERFNYYFGIILQGSLEEFQKLKEYIIKNTGLSIKYSKSSRLYLLIQPTLRQFSKENKGNVS